MMNLHRAYKSASKRLKESDGMITVKAEITFVVYSDELNGADGDYEKVFLQNAGDGLISMDNIRVINEEDLDGEDKG
jgi:hypothetical protein